MLPSIHHYGNLARHSAKRCRYSTCALSGFRKITDRPMILKQRIKCPKRRALYDPARMIPAHSTSCRFQPDLKALLRSVRCVFINEQLRVLQAAGVLVLSFTTGSVACRAKGRRLDWLRVTRQRETEQGMR